MKTTITNYEKELLEIFAGQAEVARLMLSQTKAALAHVLLVDPAADELGDDLLDELVNEGNRSIDELVEKLQIDVVDQLTDDDPSDGDGGWSADDHVSLGPAASESVDLVLSTEEAQSP